MKRIGFTLLIFILFAFPISVLADAAPPYNPPGSNVDPGSEITQVRMVAETVLVDVQADTTPNSLGSARVTADFTMHNIGNEAENLAVRFPISSNDGRDVYPEIADLIISIDGKQVSYRRANYPDPLPDTWRTEKVPKEILLTHGYEYRSDAGGEELYQSSVNAYEKCLTLLPMDAQWHAGCAELLANRDYWQVFTGGGPTANTLRALDEIRIALQLAPNDSKVLAIAKEINAMAPDGMSITETGYDYPWLTQTPLLPTPVAALVENSTPAPHQQVHSRPLKFLHQLPAGKRSLNRNPPPPFADWPR